jgi:hypothetical protein
MGSINYHDQLLQESWNRFSGRKMNSTFQKWYWIWSSRRKLSHLVHIRKKDFMCEVVPSFVSCIHTCWIVHLEWPFKTTIRVSFIYFGSLKNRGPKMASHGLIQWTCIATMTSKVNAIFKSSTWGIDGNVRKKQVYLLSSIIVVKNFMRLILLSSTKLSTQMC